MMNIKTTIKTTQHNTTQPLPFSRVSLSLSPLAFAFLLQTDGRTGTGRRRSFFLGSEEPCFGWDGGDERRHTVFLGFWVSGFSFWAWEMDGICSSCVCPWAYCLVGWLV